MQGVDHNLVEHMVAIAKTSFPQYCLCNRPVLSHVGMCQPTLHVVMLDTHGNLHAP